jgi:DNA transposition AAA+ family ATPase
VSEEKKEEAKTETGGAAPAVQGQERASWPFGGDQVTAATAQLEEKQRNLVRWLFFYSIENAISMKSASDKIGYSSTTVYRLLRGEYEGNVAEVCAGIARWKRLCDERAEIKEVAFVETATCRKVWQICDAANIYRSVAVIYGDSQIGKTWALQEYARRHNHGQTRYVRLPAAAGVQMLIRNFAHACGISPKSSFEQLRERVVRATDENTLWLVDELHQAFTTYQRHARVACLELIREIHDLTQCGMVLCGTNTARDEIETGQHKELLAQLRRRGIFRLQLPAFATWPDRIAIAKHFGLKDAPEGQVRELIDGIIRKSGLKAYTSFLQAATRIAAKRKAAIEWKHFITAHDVIARLSLADAGDVED